MPTDAPEIPYWRSHKIVQAAKITGMQFPPEGPTICMGDIPAKALLTDKDFGRMVGMTDPAAGDAEAWANLVGGYYIRYEDGYQSWSPAAVFEAGYRGLDLMPVDYGHGRERNEWAHKGQWADEEKWGQNGWDQDTGAPSIGLLGTAIQCWAILQNRINVTVAEAARAFNVPTTTIRAAVEDHPWMYLEGPDDTPDRQIIGHDGE